MKKNILISAVIFYTSICSIYAQISDLDNLRFIKGDTFVMNRNFITNVDDKIDSTYLYHSNLKRISVSNYFLSNQEVTNGEYWEFIHWVQDSVARKYLFEYSSPLEKTKWGSYVDYKTFNVDSTGRYFVLNWKTPLELSAYPNGMVLLPIRDPNYRNSDRYEQPFLLIDKLRYCYVTRNEENKEFISDLINIYPNTEDWKHAFPYGFDEYSNNYFRAIWYKNYPVVGISWIQANAYCHWKTKLFRQQYHSLSRKQKKYFSSDSYYRLPTEAEWEFATIGKNQYQSDHHGFDKKNDEYQSNFGRIVTNSNILLKSYQDDGHLISAPVGSFTPNCKRIYDLFGNVSEWTADTINENECKFVLPRSGALDAFIPFSRVYRRKDIKQPPITDSLLDEKRLEQLYITDPLTNETHLVTQGSEEHLKIFKIRMDYFAVNPEDSREEIKKKYLAFNSIDTAYYDSILRLNDDYFHYKKRHPTPSNYYCNYRGTLSNFDGGDSFRLYNIINQYKHDHAVFKRASDFNSLGYYKTNNRVVKGGSWADSPQYLITGSREVYNETESSCKVGFRVAMNAPSNLDFLSFREKKRLKNNEHEEE